MARAHSDTPFLPVSSGQLTLPVEDPSAAPSRIPGFSVSLEQFEGPFDLLLHLIARKRLDVTELALASVTDEFVAYMRSDWNLSAASEFVVVASTLLALKAHRLLPHDGEDDEDLDFELLEARDLLFARLLQYRAFKEASRYVAKAMEAGSASWPRIPPEDPDLAQLLPTLVFTLGPEDLVKRAAAAFTRPDGELVTTMHMHEPTVPVETQIGLMRERIKMGGTVTFAYLIGDTDRLPVVISRFLAVLILFREGLVNIAPTQSGDSFRVEWNTERPHSDLPSDDLGGWDDESERDIAITAPAEEGHHE
ncbi:segregation and condensation protein A [Actinomyces vulturis]|uniref:segregation and condensation protein A n=1 Tax=Actinomyces vulturis TaxID=1857645 RepID=UPI000834B2AC|nr:ScpA family protein [Actinomyces vulturis]